MSLLQIWGLLWNIQYPVQVVLLRRWCGWEKPQLQLCARTVVAESLYYVHTDYLNTPAPPRHTSRQLSQVTRRQMRTLSTGGLRGTEPGCLRGNMAHLGLCKTGAARHMLDHPGDIIRMECANQRCPIAIEAQEYRSSHNAGRHEPSLQSASRFSAHIARLWFVRVRHKN
jgi:hypothetical protein